MEVDCAGFDNLASGRQTTDLELVHRHFRPRAWSGTVRPPESFSLSFLPLSVCLVSCVSSAGVNSILYQFSQLLDMNDSCDSCASFLLAHSYSHVEIPLYLRVGKVKKCSKATCNMLKDFSLHRWPTRLDCFVMSSANVERNNVGAVNCVGVNQIRPGSASVTFCFGFPCSATLVINIIQMCFQLCFARIPRGTPVTTRWAGKRWMAWSNVSPCLTYLETCQA